MITTRDDLARALERLRGRDPEALAAFILSLRWRNCHTEVATDSKASAPRVREATQSHASESPCRPRTGVRTARPSEKGHRHLPAGVQVPLSDHDDVDFECCVFDCGVVDAAVVCVRQIHC
jgi:hypothetical protein